MSDRGAALVEEWVSRPENTARTVLVTIFGDTIEPVTSNVWLAQLFSLTDALGYSERLVRTSMTRLVKEGWLGNERVGRESRYSLTASARDETLEASQRIYRDVRPSWAGAWSVVFVDAPHIPGEVRDRAVEHLGWHGYVRLSRGVVGSPAATPDRTRDLCELVAPDILLPSGTLAFDDLDAVVGTGFFDAGLALTELTAAYERFIAFHRRVAAVAVNADGPQAFALRTMLVHDLRRIRLRSPDLPSALLPERWIGSAAYELAGDLSAMLGPVAAAWLTDVLGTPYPEDFAGRFSSPALDAR